MDYSPKDAVGMQPRFSHLGGEATTEQTLGEGTIPISPRVVRASQSYEGRISIPVCGRGWNSTPLCPVSRTPNLCRSGRREDHQAKDYSQDFKCNIVCHFFGLRKVFLLSSFPFFLFGRGMSILTPIDFWKLKTFLQFHRLKLEANLHQGEFTLSLTCIPYKCFLMYLQALGFWIDIRGVKIIGDTGMEWTFLVSRLHIL